MDALRRHPILACIGAVLAALVALIGINAFDQELSPEARAYFERPAPRFVADSGWALIAGFNAPAGDDARAYAASLQRAASTRKAGTRASTGARELDVLAPDELLCLPESVDCTRAFSQRPEVIADLAADNAVLLSRYDQLQRLPGLTDDTPVLEFYMGTPSLNVVMRTQRVRMSQVGAAVGSGHPEVAIAWLEADGALYRRWLDEAGSLLAKMIATRGLSRDLLLAGQVARSGASLAPRQWDALERITAALTQTQRGVGPVLRTEGQFFAQVLDKLVADSRTTGEITELPRTFAALLSLTVKRNATLNFAYPLFAEWATLDALASDALDPAVERARATIRRAGDRDITWLYNYSGKSYTAEAPPDLGEYLYRVRDLDALAAVVRCVVALQRSGTGASAAGAYVASSASCRNPYGGALGWDEATRELSFKARSTGQVKRFGGRGDRIVFAAYAS